MIISPEVIAEQVMGYVVWASELIPTLTPPKTPYSVAILPKWPHFYTWLLQATGYLLLDNKKKKMLIISQQSDDKKNIIVDSNTFWPMLWQARKISPSKLSAFARSIGGKLSDKKSEKLQENVHFQLPFLRVITNTKEIIHVSIGDTVTKIQIKKICTWIHTHVQEYNIVLLTNFELSPSTNLKKSDEHKQIVKSIETSSLATPLLMIFQNILKFQKKKPEIVAYVNPGDFNKNGSLLTRYICAVG